MGNSLYLIRSLLRRGPGFLWLYLKESLWFDLVNRTNTHMRVPKPELSGDDPGERRDGLLYVASLTGVVRQTARIALNHLEKAGFPTPQFVDLGCGKGKALLVYAKELSTHNGKPDIGIEYDRELCEIAWQNIDRIKGMPNGLRVYCDSALNLDEHVEDGPLIVYLYNSFQGQTLRSVLKRLARYPHVLIYVDPVERAILPGYGYEMIAENSGKYNAETWLVAVRC